MKRPGVLESWLVTGFSVVISPSELASLLGQPGLCIVDCRASLQDPAAGRRAYLGQHLPEACFADLLEDLSGPIVPGVTGRHPLPALDVFVAKLRAWGVGKDSQVVAYDDASGVFAARLWWMLRWLGHVSVAVLDGGLPAWVAEGYPLSVELPKPELGDFVPAPRSGWLVSTAELAASESRPGKLFDARAPERYRGDVEPIDPVAGHIPGAENLPFADNLRDGRLKPAAELRARFASALGETQPEDAIVYCGSGVTACHDVLAFAQAGLPLPKVYAGSWSEWITDPSRPTARGDGSAV